MTEKSIYQRAIDMYGPELQMLKAKEECAEFLVATLQYEQGRVPIGAVINELADVIITSRGARLILGPELVDLAIDRKLARLEGRMSSVPMTRKKGSGRDADTHLGTPAM